MSGAPSPDEIFERAVDEGERRLDQSLLELVSTSFIAGFTIIFGIVALGIVEAAVHPLAPELSTLAGALAFGLGVVFLVVGRAELFNENFFDPVAKAVDADGTWLIRPLVRLWVVTFALNLAGGVILAWFLSFEGALPTGTGDALARFAEHLLRRNTAAVFGSAFAGGALVTLLSYMLAAADDSSSRMALAYAVGFLLSLGPFDHVIVTALHAVFGLFFGAQVTLVSLGATVGVVTAGNFAGGLGLVTLTHVTQVMGAREEGGGNGDSENGGNESGDGDN